MSSQAPDDEVTRLWQAQTDGEPMMLNDIRARAATFERRIRWRNLVEYGAAVVVVAGYARILWNGPNILARVGATLILFAVVYVVYQLRAHGTVSVMPEHLALSTCLDFHRAQLLRQRDPLRSTWTWYLLPFAPGLLVLLVGLALEGPDRVPRVAMSAIACVLVFLGVGWFNARSARKLDREIEVLDSTT